METLAYIYSALSYEEGCPSKSGNYQIQAYLSQVVPWKKVKIDFFCYPSP